mgnify:CR=1 FL=1
MKKNGGCNKNIPKKIMKGYSALSIGNILPSTNKC